MKETKKQVIYDHYKMESNFEEDCSNIDEVITELQEIRQKYPNHRITFSPDMYIRSSRWEGDECSLDSMSCVISRLESDYEVGVRIKKCIKREKIVQKWKERALIENKKKKEARRESKIIEDIAKLEKQLLKLKKEQK